MYDNSRAQDKDEGEQTFDASEIHIAFEPCNQSKRKDAYGNDERERNSTFSLISFFRHEYQNPLV